jgi:hypothetical protein
MKRILAALLLLVAISSRGQRRTQIVPAFFLISDTSTRMQSTTMVPGYLKQELHNTSEGVMDPGGSICIDQQGNTIPCYHDYWVTIEQLGIDKKPLSSWCIVWQAVEDKRKRKTTKP